MIAWECQRENPTTDGVLMYMLRAGYGYMKQIL